MAVVLRTERLTKRFDRLTAVRISTSRSARRVFGFLGPNGAGRTTTLRLLCALIAPASGTAGAGFRLGSQDEQIASVSILTEHPGLYRRQSAEDLCSCDAVRARTRDRTLTDRALPAAHGPLESPRGSVATFSRGMKRRWRSRAAIHEPRIVFLDEPTTGLDPARRGRSRKFIARIRGEGGPCSSARTTSTRPTGSRSDRLLPPPRSSGSARASARGSTGMRVPHHTSPPSTSCVEPSAASRPRT